MNRDILVTHGRPYEAEDFCQTEWEAEWSECYHEAKASALEKGLISANGFDCNKWYSIVQEMSLDQIQKALTRGAPNPENTRAAWITDFESALKQVFDEKLDNIILESQN